MRGERGARVTRDGVNAKKYKNITPVLHANKCMAGLATTGLNSSRVLVLANTSLHE